MTTYTILTTDSSSRLSWLHDRMPALLVGEEAVNTWLTGEKGIMEVCACVRQDVWLFVQLASGYCHVLVVLGVVTANLGRQIPRGLCR